MELYKSTSYELSRRLTLRYSTSFSMSSRLFSKSIRPHIYAIYGLVRIADEIVDTYQGEDAPKLLDELEAQAERALSSGYSSNPIVHSFCLTARAHDIEMRLVEAFFASMRMDLEPKNYTADLYEQYIYGSAEVIGLMCLKVFVSNDQSMYDELAPGAQALGAAYQKVNFLRDVRDDFNRLGRMYFPEVTFETFSQEQKRAIEEDIERDFSLALSSISQLPRSARPALMLSYDYYYYTLFEKLKRADIDTLKNNRVRIPNGYKLLLLGRRMALR